MIWTEQEKKLLIQLVERTKYKRIPWTHISRHPGIRHSAQDCKKRYYVDCPYRRIARNRKSRARKGGPPASVRCTSYARRSAQKTCRDTIEAAAHLGVAVDSMKQFNEKISMISDEFQRKLLS